MNSSSVDRLQLARQQAQQRSLAAAVRAGQRGAVSRIDGEAYLLQQWNTGYVRIGKLMN
jgi:hypothetical protein